jgi:hypothetical protein
LALKDETASSCNNLTALEQINNVYLPGRDLLANPCREILAGWLCRTLSDNLKRKTLLARRSGALCLYAQ